MWIYESMAIMGTYSDRSMDYDIVLWTYYNASLINAIGAIIISTLIGVLRGGAKGALAPPPLKLVKV